MDSRIRDIYGTAQRLWATSLHQPLYHGGYREKGALWKIEMTKFFRRTVVMGDWWQQHEDRSVEGGEVVMNRPEGAGDPGGEDQPEIFLKRGSGSKMPHIGHKMYM